MAFDVIAPKKLGFGSVSASPTVTTFYTVGSLYRTILKTIDICNTGSTPLNVTVYLVESGGSPGISNTLIPNVPVSPNSFFQWTGTQVLNEGDSIRAVASASGITLHASGGECS